MSEHLLVSLRDRRRPPKGGSMSLDQQESSSTRRWKPFTAWIYYNGQSR
jgi:hypothetical protein